MTFLVGAFAILRLEFVLHYLLDKDLTGFFRGELGLAQASDGAKAGQEARSNIRTTVFVAFAFAVGIVAEDASYKFMDSGWLPLQANSKASLRAAVGARTWMCWTSRIRSTHERIEGLTLRLYNPESREWGLYWANGKTGTLAVPASVGRFNNGRGEFYDHEDYKGRPIVVRYLWSDITPTSAHFEQSFSADGGKTWEPNWISTITRVRE